MKILVTGASGFIGSRLVERLAHHHEISCILRTPPSENLKKKLAGASLLVGSFRHPSFLKTACENVEVVIHCAGLAGTWGKKEDYQEANINLTYRLAEAAHAAGVKKWIQLSSPSIYFDFKDQFNIPETFVPEIFSSHYAETKYQADRLLVTGANSFKTIVLRPRFVLGLGDQQIVPRLLRYLQKGYYPLVGNGQQLIDITNVGNICDAVELALAAPNSSWNEIYNVTNGKPIVFREFVEELQRRAGNPSRIVKIPKILVKAVAQSFKQIENWTGRSHPQWLHPVELGVMTNAMTLDIQKAKSKLGYKPEADFRVALNEYRI